MRALAMALTLLALAPAVTACAHRGTAGEPAPADASRLATSRRTDLLTIEEFGNRDWASIHDLVSTLRPNWLNLRGSDTINGQPMEVRVLLDGIPLGGASTLHEQQVTGVQYLQYYDPFSAAARWGLGYGKGAIYISMRRP